MGFGRMLGALSTGYQDGANARQQLKLNQIQINRTGEYTKADLEALLNPPNGTKPEMIEMAFPTKNSPARVTLIRTDVEAWKNSLS